MKFMPCFARLRDHRIKQIVFFVQVFLIAGQLIFVILFTNLILRLSLTLGGYYKNPTHINRAHSIAPIPFFGHYDHEFDVKTYTLTAVLLLVLIVSAFFSLVGLLKPRRPRRLKLGIIVFGVSHGLGFITGLIWTILFFCFRQDHPPSQPVWWHQTLVLMLINAVFLVTTGYYFWLNYRLGKLDPKLKLKLTPDPARSQPTKELFFNPEVMKTSSFSQRIFYLRSCKNRSIFALDRHWIVILKIYCPQILLSLMWLGYEMINRILIIHFAPSHYHASNPDEIISALTLALRYMNSVYAILFILVTFVTAPLQMLFTKSIAHQDRQTAERLISFSLFMSAVIVLIFVPFGIGFANFFIKIHESPLKTDTNLLSHDIALPLIRITFASLPFLLLFFIVFDLLICEGRVYFFLIASFLYLGSQMLFIFFLVKYTELKASSAPLGELISAIFNFAILFLVIALDRSSWIRFRWRWIRPYPAEMFDFFKIGFSSVLKIITIIFAQIWFVQLAEIFPVHSEDYSGSAKANLIVQFVSTFGLYAFLVRSVLIGISIANRQILTYCYTRGMWYRFRQIVKIAILLSFTWWLLTMILAWTMGMLLLHQLNPSLPPDNSKLILFLGLTITGIVNRVLNGNAADILQSAGKRNATLGIYLVNLFLGVILPLFFLWSLTWVTFLKSGGHGQFILFLYSDFRLVLAVIIVGYCYVQNKPLYRAIKNSKLSDDTHFITEIQQFRDNLRQNYNNKITVLAHQYDIN